MIRFFSASALVLAACGLVSTDITLFKLKFPPKDFAVDASAWGLPSGTVPAVSCQAGCPTAAVCPSGSCRADCDSASQTCQAHVPITVKNDYNLSTEAPEYASFANQSVVSVTVDDIFFNITENSLNVDTPVLQVVIGPQTINAASDAGAELVGTIPVVHAGQTGRVDVVFTGTGSATLKRFMDNFKTPFRVLVTGDIVVKGGQATPTGRLVGQVIAEAHVSLGG